MTRPAAIEVKSIARLFRALGDETRLRIVALLSIEELCVCHLQQALDLSQPNVSRQLAVLRAAGVVDDRREGSWVYYRLREQQNEACERHLRGLVQSFAGHQALRRDVARLVKVRGPGACR